MKAKDMSKDDLDHVVRYFKLLKRLRDKYGIGKAAKSRTERGANVPSLEQMATASALEM